MSWVRLGLVKLDKGRGVRWIENPSKLRRFRSVLGQFLDHFQMYLLLIFNSFSIHFLVHFGFSFVSI